MAKTGKSSFDYALMLLEYLKRNSGELRNSREFRDISAIAGEFALPAAYLEKVAQELKRAGWLESRRGKGGGYKLAKDPASVSIASLIALYKPIYSFCPVLRKLKR